MNIEEAKRCGIIFHQRGSVRSEKTLSARLLNNDGGVSGIEEGICPEEMETSGAGVAEIKRSNLSPRQTCPGCKPPIKITTCSLVRVLPEPLCIPRV